MSHLGIDMLLSSGKSNVRGSLLGVSRQVFLTPKHENREGLISYFLWALPYLYVMNVNVRGARMREKATY